MKKNLTLQNIVNNTTGYLLDISMKNLNVMVKFSSYARHTQNYPEIIYPIRCNNAICFKGGA